jgi:hypothetical protein
MHSPGQLWHEVVSAQPMPSRWIVAVGCLAALILVASRRLWPLTRTLITIAHEGGHALVALVVGRRLEGVRVHRSTAGLTVSAGHATGPGIVATAAAGYLAPPLLGLGAAALLASGHLAAALLFALALLAGLLLLIRNAYGLLAVFGLAAILAFVIWRGVPLVQAVFGYAMAWFLLLGGVRPVLELQRSRRRGRAGRSDADQLARLTGVPAGAWVALFATVAVGAVALSGFWLMY